MHAVVKKCASQKGEVTAPPSKSYTHRAFIIAALAEGTSRIKNALRAGDTLTTLKACRAFGARIEENESIVIHGTGGKPAAPNKIIDCENSGTSIRLLSSVAALAGEVTLTGDASIQRRPMQLLLDALMQLGVEAFSTKGNGTPPVVIKGGGIKGGSVEIRGDISSQFISSLLISAPYAKSDVEIMITTPLKSKPYVDITLDIMRSFGTAVKNENYTQFLIKAGQKYRARDYSVEGDYSSASYFLALAAMSGGEITVKNLRGDSKQGDRIILDVLKEMGANVKLDRDRVTVSGNELNGIETDLSDSPDLLPTIAALACRAKGTSVIKNVEHARYKESDRLDACASQLRKFGAKIEEKKDGLIIKGEEKLRGAEVESYEDHRMAMALTLLGLVSEGETVINGAECVRISFPEFYEITQRLCPKCVELKD